MSKTGFDKFFDEQMRDPEAAAAYREARAEIDSIDALVRALDSARQSRRLSKAKLAHAARIPAASVRRLFTADRPNPSFSTIVGLLTSMGFALKLVPAGGNGLPARPRPLRARPVRSKAARTKRVPPRAQAAG